MEALVLKKLTLAAGFLFNIFIEFGWSKNINFHALHSFQIFNHITRVEIFDSIFFDYLCFSNCVCKP